MTDSIVRLRDYVKNAQKIVFFGGAGVSTESGVKDFRGVDGLYRQKYQVPPEVILSHTYFETEPEKFFAFYRDKMLCLNAKPNPAHQTLARWEKEGKLLAVVTQNIDGLHQAAGSQAVYELHGSVLRNYCTHCGKSYSAEEILRSHGVPKCNCGGTVKPDVVLYEEALDEDILLDAVNAIREADLLLVAGTSLTVYPAAGLLRYRQKNCPLVLINRDETERDSEAELVIHDSVGKILSEI